MYHIFGSRLLFWLSNLKNPRLKVRVLIIWRVIILGLIIWMYSTGLGMYPRFYCGPQGDPHLDCCLDHCRVPRTQTLPRTPAHVVAYLQSEVVTCLPLLFIEANAISLLSGRLSSFEGYLELGGKYHSMCTNTFFVWYFLHSPHDPKKVRVIKEYFMGKVMLGFIGSNSNMAFAITDIIVWLFKFTIKYVMYFTKFQTRFFDSIVWNSCGKEHCQENSVWEIFSPTFVSSIKR